VTIPPLDITLVVGRDLGLMIRAFAASLEDEQLLVRRGILDLLVQSVRIDGSAFKRYRIPRLYLYLHIFSE
jgi:hypothetical protein